MDVENSLLTRLAANGPTMSDAPMLLMAVVLVLALSGVASTVSQQRQKANEDETLQGRKLTRKLSNIGLSTLVTEVPTNLSIPVSVLTVEGHLTKEDYIERLRARLLHDAFFLRWRSVVRGDYKTGVYKYVEVPDYDVAQNVVEHTVDEGETTMSYVESAIVNTPLDFDKPLWEMHVIHDPKATRASPASEMSLCKSQVSGFYGFVPPPPSVNLGVAILSMGDNLGLNVLVDPCVGVNAKQFLEFAKEEFTALQESVAAIEANANEDKKTK
ncbi:hypothetical protein AM588_10000390 [Phytophthora nicotianae]|uniref:O-acyltransferase WSD1 C-terminal domain-containing protein n=1 Tax=Phytophthora nicotianae TaxID=4792 RepID=A0A0W8CE75_PHYNI|nr:hypothetical protein AM588_10000390 [Phytophthora nicotianae]